MATVLDALVVTLGLDPRKFTEGQKTALEAFKKTQEQSTRTAKEMEERGKQAAQFFSKVRNEVIALGAALLGAAGLEQFISRMTRADAATGRMAKNLGVSVRDLSEWQHAAERMGGSAEATSGSIKGLVTEFQRMSLTGDSEILRPLALAGVDMARFVDQATPATEKLLLLSDAFHKLPRQRALFLGAQIGLDEGTMNVLLGDARKLLEIERQHGVTTEKDAAAAIKLANAWHDLSRTFTDAGEKMLTALTPALGDLMTELAAYVDVHKDEITQWAKDLAEWIKNIDWPAVKQGLSDFVTGANKAAEAVGGWVRVAEILLGLWVGSKFLAMMANIGAIGAALSTGPVALLLRLAALAAGPAALGLALGMEPTTIDPKGTEAAKLGQTNAGFAGIVSQLTASGVDPRVAQGIASRIVLSESGGNPLAQTNPASGENSFGMAQWNGERLANLKSFSSKNNLDYRSADAQTRFIAEELLRGSERGRYAQMLAGIGKGQSPAEAADWYYERSAQGYKDRIAAGGGIPMGARGVGAGMPTVGDPALASAGAANWRSAGNSTTNVDHDVSVGSITINTQATDASAMARDVTPAFQKFFFVPQANYGMQ